MPAPPTLQIVLAEHTPRSERIRISLTPLEVAELTRQARTAGIPTATMASALVRSGLAALAAGSACAEDGAALIHEAPAIRRDGRGSLDLKNNPEPWQATGSTQGGTNPPMENQQAVGAGGCCEQLTESPAIAATLQ